MQQLCLSCVGQQHTAVSGLLTYTVDEGQSGAFLTCLLPLLRGWSPFVVSGRWMADHLLENDLKVATSKRCSDAKAFYDDAFSYK